MARWKLTEPHYLNVPGTMWEMVTTDRVTQRPIRKQFPVPLFLDPRIMDDWNYRTPENPMDGEIIVAYAGKGQPRDIIFEGNPTPGMLPLDDEAKEISGRFDWTPTTDLTDEAQRASHQTKILDGLIQRLAEANVATTGAAPAGFEHLMNQMAAMMQQQTQLLAMLLQKNQQAEFEQQARAIGADAPVDDEPLGEADGPTEEEIATAEVMARDREEASRRKAQAVAESSAKRRV